MQMLSKANERPVMARIGKVARRLLLVPLAATIMSGCADECNSFNETTITINRKTDGKISNINDLAEEPEGTAINKSLRDLINETHAVSTTGLPDGVKITRVPGYCVAEYGWGAYVNISDDILTTGDTGIYVTHPYTVAGVYEINHEIGHLQPYGWKDEFIAYINEFEQELNGTVFLVMQGWTEKSSYLHWEFSAVINLFVNAVWNVKNGLVDQISAYEAVESESHRSMVFIFLRLVKSDGDIQALRDQASELEARGLANKSIDAEINGFVENPIFGYYDRDKSAAVAEVKLQLAMLFTKAVSRRFGLNTAIIVFDDAVHKNSAFKPNDPAETTVCAKIAPMEESTRAEAPQDKRFCCIDMDIDASDDSQIPVFRKLIIEVDEKTKELSSKTNIALGAPCE